MDIVLTSGYIVHERLFMTVDLDKKLLVQVVLLGDV
jgi:hypothetical protein